MVSDTAALELLKDSFRINKGSLFCQMLKKWESYHFFQTKVRNAKNVYFEPDYETIFWSEIYTWNQLLNEEGLEYYEFIIDVRINGSLNEFNKKGITFSSLAVEFNFTIHAFVFKDWNSISEDYIKLLNNEQKILLLFTKNYEKEVEKIKVKLLSEYTYLNEEAFTFFTRIWKLVDPLDLTMVNDTSLEFFGELVECHRNIRYSVGCANILGRYTTHYSKNEYTFQGEKLFPVGLDYHDYRYFFYVENAIEEIYTFYERLSYLLYIFLKPVNFEVHSLSFKSYLIGKQEKRLKRNISN